MGHQHTILVYRALYGLHPSARSRGTSTCVVLCLAIIDFFNLCVVRLARNQELEGRFGMWDISILLSFTARCMAFIRQHVLVVLQLVLFSVRTILIRAPD